MKVTALFAIAGAVSVAASGPAQAQKGADPQRAAILKTVRASGTLCEIPAEAKDMAYGPPQIEWRRDINGDGRPEALVVEGGTYCYGNTGQGFWLLTRQPNGIWTIVAQETGIATLLATKGPGGWPDLEVGGPGLCFPVLRWTGKAYRSHRQAYEGKPCGDSAESGQTTPTLVKTASPRPASRRRSAKGSKAPASRPPVGVVQSAPPPPPLPPFDVRLTNVTAPVGDTVTWSGVGLFSAVLSKVTLQANNVGGKLSGFATVRPVNSPKSAELKVDGRVKGGDCQVKIETIGTFKGRCSSAGFTGTKGFLGSFDGALIVYNGGAEAMARAGTRLSSRLGFGGNSTSTDGAFSMEQYFLLNQAGGVLLGTARNRFSESGVAGAAFDGSCILLTTSGSRYEGTCGSQGWRGMTYSGNKPSNTLALAALSEQQVAAGIAAQAEQVRANAAALEAQRASLAPPNGGVAATEEPQPGYPGQPAQTRQIVTATGRARYLVEPGGGCGPETMLLKGYCFDEAINVLEQDPRKNDITVIAARQSLPLGARIGRGEYLYVQVKRRKEGGYYADKDLRGYSKVQVPQGCMYRGASNEGYIISLAEGRKAAVEVTDYSCG